MLNRLILKVTKFQLPPPKRLGTVVKNILGGGHHGPPCQIGLRDQKKICLCSLIVTCIKLLNPVKLKINYISKCIAAMLKLHVFASDYSVLTLSSKVKTSEFMGQQLQQRIEECAGFQEKSWCNENIWPDTPSQVRLVTICFSLLYILQIKTNYLKVFSTAIQLFSNSIREDIHT